MMESRRICIALVVIIVGFCLLDNCSGQSVNGTDVNETQNANETITPAPAEFVTLAPLFQTLKLSDVLRAKALIRWLVNNRTENGKHTFNAGFIRLAFHDCIGGCDGCVNLNNPGNRGLAFYKGPLDLMYNEFVFPTMSKADWYMLAGITAVEYAAELSNCAGEGCIPPMKFMWGRQDCDNERNIFRIFPGTDADGRQFIRQNFRMNLQEVVAILGAHTLGRNHATPGTPSWVSNEEQLDNQFFKDMLNSQHNWTIGMRTGQMAQSFAHGKTGEHIMMIDDMFLAYDMSPNNLRRKECRVSPVDGCPRSNTFRVVQQYANNNKKWLREFGQAFTVLTFNGHFGKLKEVEIDTTDEVFTGELFPPSNDTDSSNSTESANVEEVTEPPKEIIMLTSGAMIEFEDGMFKITQDGQIRFENTSKMIVFESSNQTTGLIKTTPASRPEFSITIPTTTEAMDESTASTTEPLEFTDAELPTEATTKDTAPGKIQGPTTTESPSDESGTTDETETVIGNNTEDRVSYRIDRQRIRQRLGGLGLEPAQKKPVKPAEEE